VDPKEKKKGIEAYGVKGMESTPWRQTFTSSEALMKWAKQNNAEIQGTRESDYYLLTRDYLPVGDVSKELSVPEKHQLRIAKQTLKYSDAGARIMGGPTKEEAREIILRLTGKRAVEEPE
jgi:hypothetical protein